MKYAIWGDLHAHPWQEAERPLRWLEMLHIIQDVYAQAFAHQCSHVIFLGDLFEAKKEIRSDVLTVTLKTLMKQIREAKAVTVLVAGNHDLYSESCILSILDGYAGKTTVVAASNGFGFSTVPSCGDSNLELYGYDLCLPYNGHMEEGQNYRYLFTHREIRGCAFNPYTSSTDSDIGEGLFTKKGDRKRVFNGHYHRPQTITKYDIPIHCIGAPCEHNWTDMDSSTLHTRSILILDTKTDTIKTIALPRYPRFFSQNGATEFSDYDSMKDFVRNVPIQEGLLEDVTALQTGILAGKNINEEMISYVKQYYAGELSVGQLVMLGTRLYSGE